MAVIAKVHGIQLDCFVVPQSGSLALHYYTRPNRNHGVIQKNAIFVQIDVKLFRDHPLLAPVATNVVTSAIRSCSPGYERDTEVALRIKEDHHVSCH